jgi:hypothetical protein
MTANAIVIATADMITMKDVAADTATKRIRKRQKQ